MQPTEMTREQLTDAVHALARDGHGDHEVSRITGLHVSMVRRVLAEPTGGQGQRCGVLAGDRCCPVASLNGKNFGS